MKIICISGKAQHGKDMVSTMMKDSLELAGYKVLVTHFADLLKYICKTFFDWDGEKDEKGRTLLQWVGTDIIRKKKPDYWANFIVGVLTFFKGEWDYVLISDCRFPNEYETLVRNGFNTSLVRIERPNFNSPLSLEQQKHLSETALDNYEADYQIINDGSILDLNKKVSELVRHI